MNLRLGEKNVRVRITFEEAQTLLNRSQQKYLLALPAGQKFEVHVTVTEAATLRVDYPKQLYVEVPRNWLESAVAGVGEIELSGDDFTFEIDRFSTKHRNRLQG